MNLVDNSDMQLSGRAELSMSMFLRTTVPFGIQVRVHSKVISQCTHRRLSFVLPVGINYPL